MSTDMTKPMARVIAFLPPELIEKADELAKQDSRFHLFGKPSRAAVIREAMVIFFAEDGNESTQSVTKGTN